MEAQTNDDLHNMVRTITIRLGGIIVTENYLWLGKPQLWRLSHLHICCFRFYKNVNLKFVSLFCFNVCRNYVLFDWNVSFWNIPSLSAACVEGISIVMWSPCIFKYWNTGIIMNNVYRWNDSKTWIARYIMVNT